MAELTVYIDFKSPYAYLAIEPTRRLAEQLRIEIDWYPFVLDIPSYLGSARLDRAGRVARESRSKDQWLGVKYAYYDCRRYANLRGLTIRGTEKIWDTELAAIGMLWAKRQGPDVLDAYVDGVYRPFWKRELDVEDLTVVERVLAEAGADNAGFRDFAAGEGRDENQALQAAAFDSGIFGVPTYLVGEEMFFGRQHLPRIRWHLEGARGPAPDIANPLFPDDRLPTVSASTLEVGLDPGDYECRLALPAIRSLAEDTGIELRWYPIEVHPPPEASGRGGQTRGERHRVFRSDSHLRNRARYCPDAATGMAAPEVDWRDGDDPADWAGGGKLGGPTFRLGDEVFVGRQHLPLIRAMLLNSAELSDEA